MRASCDDLVQVTAQRRQGEAHTALQGTSLAFSSLVQSRNRVAKRDITLKERPTGEFISKACIDGDHARCFSLKCSCRQCCHLSSGG